jgi:hypothetical protein
MLGLFASMSESFLLIGAAIAGDLDGVEQRLLDGDNPSAMDNRAIQAAAEDGHLAVVDRLMRDARVDPAAGDNAAIACAACNGHHAVVERLLQDPRVDPAAGDNTAIFHAASGGHLAVVELLLRDPRVDPSAADNVAISQASVMCSLGVVENLILEEGIVCEDVTEAARRFIAEHGHIAVVNRLLQEKRVYATAALNADLVTHIGMIRGRSTEVCVALQDLGLPALLTLGILDELISNSIRMAAKWNLIVAVKHFHDRRKRSDK